MKQVSILLFLLAFTVSGLSQSAAPANAISEFDVNGLKVILKRRPTSPTVAAGLFIRGGAANQPVDKAGLESLTLSVATEASAKFPRATVRKEMARMGSSISANSSYDYGVVSMASTRQHFGRTWEIFTDLIRKPVFAQADFDRTRDQLLTGLRNRGVSPDDALYSLQSKVLYSGHPYSTDPSGTIESIGKITLSDLKAYHATLLETSRLLLVVVGDIDAAELQKTVTASFGTLPRGNYVDKPVPKFAFNEPTLDISQRSLPTNYVRGVFAAPSLRDPDYYAMRVAMTILQSRVYQEVRVRRNLSYAPNAEMDNAIANTANIYVTANDANQAVKVMLNEIEEMRAGKFDVENFEGISAYFLTTYYLQQETNAAQAGELARYELVGGGWRHSLDFLENVQKVKPADVQSVAQKYMKNIRFFVVGDPKAIDRVSFIGR
jgi:zinc protease